MRISEVCHQDRAHRMLQFALANDRVPHAYIFHGPSGVGREMLALRLARVMLCRSPSPVNENDSGLDLGVNVTDACGECTDCKLMAAGTHPDLHLIHRQLGALHPDQTVRNRQGLELMVEVIRHFVIDQSMLKSVQGQGKVFIVRDAERMSTEAQNALLKTLEEPPPGSVLILIAASLDRLLPTTKSRCQLVEFGPLPTGFTEEVLATQRPELSEGHRRYLARFSEGRLGVAIEYAEDGVPEMKQLWGDRLGELGGAQADAFGKAMEDDAKELGAKAAEREKMSETEKLRRGMRTLIAMLSGFYRDVLHFEAGRADALINIDQAQAVEALARRCGSGGAVRAIHHLAEAELRINRNVNVGLCMESLITDLSRCVGPTESAMA